MTSQSVSNFCYKASKEFELQIPETPLWLRQHESPPDVELLKKGDSGSFGEEVMLSERRLGEDDIENPLSAPLQDLHGSGQMSAGGDHSDDSEQEQEFVSSVVSQQQRPRVHWGDLPKHTGRMEPNRGGLNEETEDHRETGNTAEEEELDEEDEREKAPAEKLDVLNTQTVQEDEESEDQSVEEATARINECSLSEIVIPTTPLSEHTPSHTSSPTNTQTSTESKHGHHNAASSNQSGLNITQVGMSRRGAAGLRDLLKNHIGEPKPDSVQVNLLKHIRRTLNEWCTEETLKFLYGADHSPSSTFTGKKEVKEEEELDEDDLEEEEEDMMTADVGEQKRPSAPAPDYKTLQKQTEQLELKVQEFYKGSWIVSEEDKELNRNEQVKVQDQITKDPALPLIDSHAQHLIQKRITVEKLSSSLRNIVGPLSLSMNDVSTELNSLVRTFRFTNTNIIHRTPEWTLIAVVLLHLLSEVSPVVLEALETSAEYLTTLMEELGLQEQDLLSLVQMFKCPSHT